MIRHPDPDFTRELALFNDQQGGPTAVDVAWHPEKERWQVFAVPQYQSSHPLAQHDATAKLMSNFPDESGKRGILLFTWCERDKGYADAGFKPLDSRLFYFLRWADTFRDKDHFKETIEDPQLVREMAEKKHLRDIVGGGVEYFNKLDKVTVSMNPATKAGAGWRDAKSNLR